MHVEGDLVLNTMYQSFSVWKRLEGGRLARYRCFKILKSGRYCVQSCDFYDQPLATNRAAEFEEQFLELLAEDPPDLRSGAFDSIADAIDAHDREFMSQEDGSA